MVGSTTKERTPDSANQAVFRPAQIPPGTVLESSLGPGTFPPPPSADYRREQNPPLSEKLASSSIGFNLIQDTLKSFSLSLTFFSASTRNLEEL